MGNGCIIACFILQHVSYIARYLLGEMNTDTYPSSIMAAAYSNPALEQPHSSSSSRQHRWGTGQKLSSTLKRDLKTKCKLRIKSIKDQKSPSLSLSLSSAQRYSSKSAVSNLLKTNSHFFPFSSSSPSFNIVIEYFFLGSAHLLFPPFLFARRRQHSIFSAECALFRFHSLRRSIVDDGPRLQICCLRHVCTTYAPLTRKNK